MNKTWMPGTSPGTGLVRVVNWGAAVLRHLREGRRVCCPVPELVELVGRTDNVPPMADENDFFGYAPAQDSLFGPGEDRLQAPVQRYLPDPEKVRQRLRRCWRPRALPTRCRGRRRMPESGRSFFRTW